ncbi:MAG: amino acid permease [Bacteroidetes bacterium]|nr:MAG: amino acid permease [Bacteroidota bacterium]PTM14814.1 MAG: amino acid permease [Bacteroidota bacterium]
MLTDKIGLLPTTALVVGNMVGSGIFLLPAALAVYGGISMLGWVCSSVGAILLALVFGNLSRLLPAVDGGPYAYTRVGLGDFPAFLVAWGYWISIWSTNAAIAVALVGYLGVFFPALQTNNLLAIVTGLGFIWGFSWINTRSIRTVGLVQLVTTVLKVMPLLFIGLVGIFYIQADHFVPFNRSGGSSWSAITNTTMLTLFAYLGMESATIPGRSIKNAATTVRRATIIGTGLTIGLYLLSSAAVMGIVPLAVLATSTAPFADAAAIFWGPAARYIVAAGAVVSTMGALNGWILIQGQIPLAAAQDGLFPHFFGRLNVRERPALGIVLSSVLVSGLMLLNYSKSLVGAFTFMMTLSTLAVITPYLFSTASYALLVRKAGLPQKSGQLGLALAAFCFSLWIIVGCGQEVVFWGFLLLMAGIPFYVGLKE